MEYNTIDNIIDDIMLEMRRNNITESESYNRKQIEQWIIQYRAMVVNSTILKGLKLSSNYYQEFNVDLDTVNDIEAGLISFVIKKSKDPIPKTCFGASSGKTLSVFDLFGNEIQIMSKKRSKINRKRRHFNSDRITSYIDDRDGKLCIDNNDFISTATVKGVFINPVLVPGFKYSSSMYPIEPSDLPEIKRLIFVNELKFNIIPDTKNDGRDAITTQLNR